MQRRHRPARKRLIGASLLAAAVAISTWSMLAACSSSSSDSPAAPAESGAETTTADGSRNPPADSGAPDVLPDTVGSACDPVKQDCADPGLRCAVILIGGNYISACEPPSGLGLVPEGQPCDRTAPGHDNCMKGFNCLPVGQGVFACNKFCSTDAECGTSGKCGRLTSQAPYYGVCWKSCTPFGTDCTGGMTCAGLHLSDDGDTDFQACRPAGSGAVDSTCAAQYDCAPDMNCEGIGGVFTCKALCDDAHACDGGTCTKLNGLPNNAGLCK